MTGFTRLTGLTNTFGKKLDNLKHAVVLHFFHYNYMIISTSIFQELLIKDWIEREINKIFQLCLGPLPDLKKSKKIPEAIIYALH